MGKPGKNRDWGYSSYNVGDDRDNYDDYEMTVGQGEEDEEDQPQDDDPELIYTSFEKSGRVNQYHDNGDGGHGHQSWEDEEDFHSGEPADWERNESNSSPNPSDEEIEEMIDDNKCYLTTACMHHYKHDFNDNCYELSTLRWFRDTFCPQQLIEHYYDIAPKVVDYINSKSNKSQFYEYMYNELVMKSVEAIENKQYEKAFEIYSKHVKALEKVFNKSKSQNSQFNTDEGEKEM